MNFPEPLERLIKVLARLPALGRRSAERIALRLTTQKSDALVQELISALEDVRSHVRCCSRCGNITLAERDPCGLCLDAKREGQILCVVEDPADIVRLESSGGFRGRYHALCGRLSPMHGDTISTAKVAALQQRIVDEKITEVILAMNSDVESDATASYLAEVLGDSVRVTRLAWGIPAGSGIAYSDPLTLSRALQGRTQMRA